MPDVRRALAYLVFNMASRRAEFPEGTPWQFVVEAVDNLVANSFVSLGLERGDDRQWRMTKATSRHARLFHAVMHVAACDLHMRGVVTVRLGFATTRIPPGTGHENAVIYWWSDMSNTVNISHARVSPREAFRSGSLFGPDWINKRLIQFLEVSDGTTEGLRRLYPEVPNLGESFDPPDDFQDNGDTSHYDSNDDD